MMRTILYNNKLRENLYESHFFKRTPEKKISLTRKSRSCVDFCDENQTVSIHF